MANSINVSLNLEGKDALSTIALLEKGIKDFGDQTKKSVTTADRAFASFAGNLAATGVAKSIGFLKDQIGASFDSFVQFERGLINVTKTANLTEQETADLSKAMLQLSREVPAATEELLGIATVAGQ